jgi:hypothetical protein
MINNSSRIIEKGQNLVAKIATAKVVCFMQTYRKTLVLEKVSPLFY